MPEHHDKNSGEVFAIWDWMFGPLYGPDRPETPTFGIGEADGTRIRLCGTQCWGLFGQFWGEIAEGASLDPARPLDCA